MRPLPWSRVSSLGSYSKGRCQSRSPYRDDGCRPQARSTAKRLRSASEQWLSAPSCVARKTTRGALPASSASCQRGAQRHQRSPGLRPGKPNCGIGVERSLPRDLENSRNAAVMTAQTVWLPMSSRPVLQQPSRKNPVMGFNEQTSSRSPRTFRGALGRPPPFPLSSVRIYRLLDRRHALAKQWTPAVVRELRQRFHLPLWSTEPLWITTTTLLRISNQQEV